MTEKEIDELSDELASHLKKRFFIILFIMIIFGLFGGCLLGLGMSWAGQVIDQSTTCYIHQLNNETCEEELPRFCRIVEATTDGETARVYCDVRIVEVRRSFTK